MVIEDKAALARAAAPEGGNGRLRQHPVYAFSVFRFGGFHSKPHLLANGGAGHIMHMLRSLSRFTINGSICSGRAFLSCVECGARTGTVWFASRQKETPLPSPLG